MYLFLISFGIILFAQLAFASGVITFESKALLPQNKELYLQDISTITSNDQEILSALHAIKVASSAHEAERMNVTDIIRIIRPHIKAIENKCECKLQIHVPKEMTEYALTGPFDPAKLENKVKLSVKEFCPSCDVEIKNSTVLRGNVPENYKHWSANIVAKELKGTSMVRVYFDDNALNPLVYQMYVGLKKPVLKLSHPLPAGSQASIADIDTVILDVTHEARDLATVDDLRGTEMKRSLGAGELISISDLILKYKIKFGDSIKVIIKNPSFEMEMTGVAQKNGRVGDKIPVRLASTRKEVSGEVLTDGRVAL